MTKLKLCRQCGAHVSRYAETCPKCGAAAPTFSISMRIIAALLAGVPSAIVLYFVLHWSGLF